jgi:hypothetical protein
VKVKALKRHYNGYGGKFAKDKGDEYEMPDEQVKALITAKLVSEVKPAADKSPGKGEDGADS